MTAARKSRQDVMYRARESFATQVDGDITAVRKGELVRDGHWLLKGREHLFEEADSFGRFDVERATAAPGEKRE